MQHENSAGNNELEWYTPSNTRIEDGILVIEARQFDTKDSPYTYTSSKIITRGKADFGIARDDILDSNCTSGRNCEVYSGEKMSSAQITRRFEARIRLPWGRGIWPAFWMLPTYDAYGGW